MSPYELLVLVWVIAVGIANVHTNAHEDLWAERKPCE